MHGTTGIYSYALYKCLTNQRFLNRSPQYYSYGVYTLGMQLLYFITLMKLLSLVLIFSLNSSQYKYDAFNLTV